MAETIRQLLSVLLAIATLVYDSMKYNRRRLEFYTYGFWNAFLLDTLMRQSIAICMIAPQYPVYISPDDETEAAVHLAEDDDDDDDSAGELKAQRADPASLAHASASLRSKSHAMARGVALDFAILLPCPRPRPVIAPLPKVIQSLAKRSVEVFLSMIPALPLYRFECSRSLDLDILVLVLTEVKKAPTRHAKTLKDLCNDIDTLLLWAGTQAEEQALCLFSCIRYSTQNEVVLIAGTGDFYIVMLATRAWAKPRVKGKWTLRQLKRAKHNRDEDAESDDESVPKLGDRDVVDCRIYHTPEGAREAALIAEESTKRLAEDRRARLAGRKVGAQQSHSTSERPSTFFAANSHEALMTCTHRGALFMETRMPADVLDGNRNEWSRVLRMGTPMSDRYQDHIAKWIKKHSDAEIKSRASAMFGVDQ